MTQFPSQRPTLVDGLAQTLVHSSDAVLDHGQRETTQDLSHGVDEVWPLVAQFLHLLP
jgi:hypothetical protein